MAKPYIPYNGPIVTRQEAKFKNMKRYFTGVPCIRGHISERYVHPPSCLACMSEYANENKEKKYKASANWAKNNPEKSHAIKNRHSNKNKEQEKERQKEYRKKNPQIVSQTKRNWLIKNPEYMREYAKNNPEVIRAASQRRRALEANAEGWHEAKDIRNIFKSQKGFCVYCNVSIKDGYHVDHIQPLSKGGSNWPNNLQLLCASCNLKKSAKDPLEFARSLGRLF